MYPQEIPQTSSPDVTRLSVQYEDEMRQRFFREEGDNPTALELFEFFGLKEVNFSELPDKIKERIIKTVERATFHHAIPNLETLKGGRPWHAHHKIVANTDFSTLYFFVDRRNTDGKEWVAWSRLRNWGNGYEIRAINHDSTSREMLISLAKYEAQVKIASETRSSLA